MREFTHFWTAHDLGDVELLHARYRSQRFAPHTHECLTLGVVLQGALAFEHRGGTRVAPAGTICVVNPGEVHTGHTDGESGWTYRNFFLGPAFLARVAREITGGERLPVFPRAVLDDPPLAAALVRLHRTLESATLRLERESLALDAVARLALRYAAERPALPRIGSEPEAVRRACELIRDDFARNLSLDDLATAARLTPFHFIRVFRRCVGLTPHAYLLQVRVERARQQLDAGRPITETALACGFADQSHLTRRFKQVIGVTPGAYRRSRNFLQDREA